MKNVKLWERPAGHKIIKRCRESGIRKTGIWGNFLAYFGGKSVFMGAKTHSGYC